MVEHGGEGVSGVLGPHEVLSDEGDVEAGGFEGGEVLGGADAGFGDEWEVVGDEGFEFDGVMEVGFHFGEVAVVDAEEEARGVCAFDDGEDSAEVGLGVDLEEGGHLERVDVSDEVGELLIGEALGDEEDGVGVDGAGLGDLVGIDDEIFAEDGERYRILDSEDVGGVSGEELLVCEAGNGRCASIGVLLRDD